MDDRIVGNGIDVNAGQHPLSTVRTVVQKKLGDPNLYDGAIGDGSAKAGEPAGKQNAQYVEVNLTGLASLADVKIPHTLGSKPTTLRLEGARNASGTPFVVATPILHERWNATTARVAIHIVSGNQAGTIVKFRVGGA